MKNILFLLVLVSSITRSNFAQQPIEIDDLENAAFNLIEVSGKFAANAHEVRDISLYYNPFKNTVELIHRNMDMKYYNMGYQVLKFTYTHSNHDKPEVRGDTLFLCSSKPGSSIKQCGLFSYKFKEGFKYIGEIEENPLKAVVEKAMLDLDKFETEKAISSLEKIPDLDTYGNKKQIAIKVLEKSYEKSIDVAKEKKTREATEILDRGFHFITNLSRSSGEQKSIVELVSSYEAYMPQERFIKIMKTLGKLHFITKDYKSSIKVNLLLCKLESDAPYNFLSVGDAFAKLGDTNKASVFYGNYKELMKKAGYADKIVDRAK